MKKLTLLISLIPFITFGQPLNDLCTNSTTIAEFGCFNGDNIGAGDDVNSCSGCQMPNCGRWDEVWFDITPTTSTIAYSLTGPGFSNISIVLYSVPSSGCPASGDLLQSDCGGPPVDGLFIDLSPGTTYYIAISGVDNEQDTFSLCFGTALPVELISFWGREIEGSNHIHWTTMSESNNDYFSIERSRDGYSWSKIGDVDGAGNSSIQNTYQFIDEKPYIYSSYYRLKQVDFDGKYKYSDIIYVENKSNIFYTYTKSEKDGYIYFSNVYCYEFYNSMGQLVLSGNGDSANTNGLSKGIYLLKIGSYTQKFYLN